MPNTSFDYAGKVAVVTGVNREIGAAIAQLFVAAGAQVYAAYHGEPERVEALLQECAGLTGRLTVSDCDLRDSAAHEALIQRAVTTYGAVDMFVANAGVTVFGPFLAMSESDYDTVFDLNLKGTFFGAQAAARQMINQGRGGRIVLSSSVTGITAMAGASVYGTSKAALCHLAAILGVELGRSGITVNAIAIGATVNDRNLADNPEYARLWGTLSPMGRVGTPHDVAQTVSYLCSDAAQLVNGHTLTIDGGWTLTSPLSMGERQQ
jgi:3-oxoacyl-[acyl-carrier protein] reductase